MSLGFGISDHRDHQPHSPPKISYVGAGRHLRCRRRCRERCFFDDSNHVGSVRADPDDRIVVVEIVVEFVVEFVVGRQRWSRVIFGVEGGCRDGGLSG